MAVAARTLSRSTRIALAEGTVASNTCPAISTTPLSGVEVEEIEALPALVLKEIEKMVSAQG
ncbi:hypothetical protein ACWEKM_28530 [Streptomyces sp. NPDC004752]